MEKGEERGANANPMRSARRWSPVLSPKLAGFDDSTRLGYGIPLKDGDERTDVETEGPYSDDEMLTHKGLRRSQSMKSVKTVKGRKEVSLVELSS